MKVMVYPRDKGETTILVVPGRAAHLAPLLLRHASKAAVMEELRVTLETHKPVTETQEVLF